MSVPMWQPQSNFLILLPCRLLISSSRKPVSYINLAKVGLVRRRSMAIYRQLHVAQYSGAATP